MKWMRSPGINGWWTTTGHGKTLWTQKHRQCAYITFIGGFHGKKNTGPVDSTFFLFFPFKIHCHPFIPCSTIVESRYHTLKLVQEIGQVEALLLLCQKLHWAIPCRSQPLAVTCWNPSKDPTTIFFWWGSGERTSISAFQLWNTQKTRLFATQQPYSTQSDQARHASHRSLGH